MKNITLRVGQAIFAASIMFSAPSYAGPIDDGIWKLENRGHASLGSDYGFGRFNGTGYDLYNFESNGADVSLKYDSSAQTIEVFGQAYDETNQKLVDFNLNYIGVESFDDRTATSFMGVIGSFDGVQVTAKPANGSDSLLLDALTGGNLTGSSWLSTSEGHFGDFHFAGERVADLPKGSVPAPGGLALILFGAAMLYRRQRAAKTHQA